MTAVFVNTQERHAKIMLYLSGLVLSGVRELRVQAAKVDTTCRSEYY